MRTHNPAALLAALATLTSTSGVGPVLCLERTYDPGTYDPGTSEPGTRRLTEPAPAPKPKRPLTDADVAALDKAQAKRDRKAQRRTK